MNETETLSEASWAKEKKITVAQSYKVLFSDKSTFCIEFGNHGLESGERLERHIIIIIIVLNSP